MEWISEFIGEIGTFEWIMIAIILLVLLHQLKDILTTPEPQPVPLIKKVDHPVKVRLPRCFSFLS